MSDALCTVPFTTIALEPGGNLGVCRMKGNKFIFGNLNKSSLKDIWTSPLLQKWRHDMLLKNPGYCAQEISHKKCHLCRENAKLELLPNSFDIVNPPITKLIANFNGHCNLRCIMCDVWKEPNGFYSKPEIMQQLREFVFPTLKEIDMLSGEPFIQSDTFLLIDELSADFPDILWSFTTNATWSLNNSVLTRLNKIKIKNIIVSIDGISHETYEKIRPPGKLSVVLMNLDNLINYQKNRGDFNIWWNFLVQKDNWHELPLAIAEMKKRGVLPYPSFLYHPSNLSLLSLDLIERKRILEFFIDQLSLTSDDCLLRISRPLLDSLPNNEKKVFWSKLKLK